MQLKFQAIAYMMLAAAVSSTMNIPAALADDQSPRIHVGSLTESLFQLRDQEPFIVRGQNCQCEDGIQCSNCSNCCVASEPMQSLVVHTGYDSFANKGDDNGSNNFGARFALNYGRRLGDNGWGMQVGAAYAGYNVYGRDNRVGVSSTTQLETAFFGTAGIYRRSNVEAGELISFGLVYDYLHDSAWGEEANPIDLHQLRMRLGVAVNRYDEVGVWSNLRLNNDRISINGVAGAGQVNSLDQINLYWQRVWAFGATSMTYAGIADDPGMFSVGFRAEAPLNDMWALYGHSHYVLPSTAIGDLAPNGVQNSFSEQNWTVQFGVSRYIGSPAPNLTTSGHTQLPLMPVADHGYFPVAANVGEL